MHCSLLLLVFATSTVYAYYDSYGTTKSYELEVPGSNPIRIIETHHPSWNRYSREKFTTTPIPWTGVEHRALKTKKVSDEMMNNVPVENVEIEDASRDTSMELNEFLKNYAEKLKRTRPISSAEQELVSDQRFHKVGLVAKPDEETTNRLADILLADNKNVSENARDNKGIAEENKGWVSLEVVPWSVSKVAKWHSSAVKQESKLPTRPSWYHLLNKQSVSYTPPAPTFKTKPLLYDPDVLMHSKPSGYDTIIPEQHMSLETLLQSPPPSIEEKLYLKDTGNYKSSWKNRYGHHGLSGHDCDNTHSAIITDGLPPNFPTYSPNLNRRKGMADDDEHPITHPFNSAGEWILVTTTKGYKPTRDRQRSLDIEALPEQESESINTHKSVRLTVLPPLNNSRINMTTSHGGLLQVESTFETVDEAQKTAEKREKMKKIPIKRKPYRNPLLAQNFPSAQVVSTIPPVANKINLPSASSVMAAVGAGMIPATMAMLVPMAMGKRRKRDLFRNNHIPIHLTNYS